jgi:hypothetical protein
VRIGVATLRSFSSGPLPGTTEELERRAALVLPGLIVNHWTRNVLDDLAERPFLDAELSPLRERGLAEEVEQLREEPTMAYGATLIVATVIEGSMLLLQIGDGDILAVRGETSSGVRAMPSDPRLIGNVTTSLCLPDAASDFRVRALDLATDAPEMLTLTTDGYADSFVDEDAFLQTGPDILRMLRDRGIGWVGEQLPGWLDRASKEGSGDDITMAILWGTPRNPDDGGSFEPPGVATATTIPSGSAETEEAPIVLRRLSSRRSLIAGAVLLFGIMIGAVVSGVLNQHVPGFERQSPTSTRSVNPGIPRAGVWVWTGGSQVVEFLNGRLTSRSIEVAKGRIVTDAEEGFGWVWVTLADGSLLRADPGRVRSTANIALPRLPAGLAIGERSVFVSSRDGTHLFIINPDTMRIRVVRFSEE